MSVELSTWVAPNAIAVMLAHLAPLGACGTSRKPDDPPDFRMVNRIDGGDDLTVFCDNAILSVHTFAPTEEAAIRAADDTHRRILLFESSQVDVPMVGGGYANVDYLEVHQRPIVSDYRVDDLVRLKGVYEISLAFLD